MHYSLASRHNFASFRSCDFYWHKRWQNNKRVYKEFFVNVINVYHIYGVDDKLLNDNDDVVRTIAKYDDKGRKWPH